MISQFGYLGIGVKDTKAWEDFATNILGLEISEKLDDGTLYLRQDEYHHRFVMEPTGEDDIKYCGWMVPTLDDFNEAQARLQAAGVTVEEGTPEECAHRKVRRFFAFEDPNGLRMEIFYGLYVLANQPFHSPRQISGFEAGNLGFGHIVVSVNDVEETERFYRDVLGFKISDYIDFTMGGTEIRASFFHVNPRHHSIAIAAIPAAQRLNHFMLQAKSIDDVGLTYDLVKSKGIEVMLQLGKHSNDQMVSFYMFTPSNFAVEFGWGAREIDDSVWVVQRHNVASIWGHEFGPGMARMMGMEAEAPAR